MGKNWAIAIGINNYDNLQPLKYAQRDAEEMQHWFKEAGFDEVFLFTENSPKIPANPAIATQPTHARFLRFLNVQFEEPLLQPEDNLWFFFAGHGIRFKDQDYLMFLDSDPQAVDRTAISVDYVVQRLRRCGADNVVLLIDACRDEGSRSGLGIGGEHKGVITFYSCTANQKSWEIDQLQHGAFTHTLLEGLRLQGEFNCATVERLDQYLRDNVPEVNSRYGKKVQNPYLKAEPPYKMYFILLKQVARLQDVLLLKNQAYQAENKDLLLAKQLWKRVVAAVGYDLEAFDAIERIAVRINRNRGDVINPSEQDAVVNPSEQDARTTINPKSNISITQPVTFLREDTSIQKTQLSTFQFDVITVNKKGERINREKRQAEYFSEDLGNNVNLDMVYIPGGKFMMGSPEEIKQGYCKYRPQHEVNVPEFFMGKYPITQEQWRIVAALPRISRDLKPEPSEFEGYDCLVERVCWYDAVEFCARLSKHTGKQYRLPSEAEWEYACRAGTTTPFHFGETIISNLADYNASETFADEPKGEYKFRKALPVGQFPPNAFGLYDMHGGVTELCLDDLHDNYDGAPTDGSAWVYDDNRYHKKVLRGGGARYTTASSCRSDSRDSSNPVLHNGGGFRIVCAASSRTPS